MDWWMVLNHGMCLCTWIKSVMIVSVWWWESKSHIRSKGWCYILICLVVVWQEAVERNNCGEGPSPAKKWNTICSGPQSKATHWRGCHMLQAQKQDDRGLRLIFTTRKSACIAPFFSSKLLIKCQGPFVVTWQMGHVDYEVVQSDRGGATQIYHLNLLKAWREAETVSLVSMVQERDQFRPVVPRSTIPAS